MLEVRGLSVGFQDRTILREVSFSVPAGTIFGLMGPAAVGKSTLLRTLGRWNETLPSYWKDGDVSLDGASVFRQLAIGDAQRRLPLLQQKARLYLARVQDNAIAEIRNERKIALAEQRDLACEVLRRWDLLDELGSRLEQPVLSLSLGQQRRLAIARLTAGGAQCLLADEPLRDLDEVEANRLQALLRRVGEELSLLVVTHHQQQARTLCTTIGLLVDRSLVEVAPTEDFFARPQTELAREYVRLGNCWPHTERSAEVSRPRETRRQAWTLPGGFHWLIRGTIGGTQQPGLGRPEADDLEALRNLGCRMLVNLTETPPDATRLASFGLGSAHFPIADMDAPTLPAAAELCRALSDWVERQLPVIVHCRAGLGRTGTVLACWLVWQGENAVRAVHRVRAVNPYSIQTPAQLAFVGEFEQYLGR